MISPNFDNVSNCKLYNQDTGELVAVGKLTDATPVLEKSMVEEPTIEPAMTFGPCNFTIDITRGSSKSMMQCLDVFAIGLYMEGITMMYYRHNSFDILKALKESGYGSGERVDFYQRILLGILNQRKKYPRGRRNVHRKKYLRRTMRIRRVA
jgi:hypothetical protein